MLICLGKFLSDLFQLWVFWTWQLSEKSLKALDKNVTLCKKGKISDSTSLFCRLPADHVFWTVRLEFWGASWVGGGHGHRFPNSALLYSFISADFAKFPSRSLDHIGFLLFLLEIDKITICSAFYISRYLSVIYFSSASYICVGRAIMEESYWLNTV